MAKIHLLTLLFTVQPFIFSGTQFDSHENLEKNLELELTFPGEPAVSAECLKVTALIINHTDTVVSFFEDWNSYGYYNIRFEVKAGDKTFLLSKYSRDWPKNFPSFKTLFPGEMMALSFFLDYDGCEKSQFSGPLLKVIDHGASIKAVYQQSKGTLADANLKGEIKYKYIYKSTGNINQRKDDWIIVDSLKVPVEVNRTFPLSKLESKEYQLKY